MKLSNSGFEFLRNAESITGYNEQTGRFLPYDDGFGFLTIGYGHKINPGEIFSNGLSADEATALFRKDIEKFESVVRDNITASLTGNQFDALVSLAYNIGADAFKKSTILKYINIPGFHSAVYPTPKTAWLAWNKINGHVSRGLTNRRIAEWNLYSNDELLPV